MNKWQGDDGYTDEQRAALRDLAAKLPPAPCCPDESRLVRDLRGMLASQGRVSEQHHKRVQELSALLAERAREIERLVGAIRTALDEWDRRDEISAVDVLRAALAARGGEGQG